MDNASPTRSFPAELQQEAVKNAGGWVYDIDPAFDRTGSVPPEHMIGAWRIEDTGLPTDEFVVNPHYRPSSPTPGRSKRRLVVAAGLILSAIVIAGLSVVLLVSPAKVDKTVRVISSPSSASAGVAHRGSVPADSTAARHRPRTRTLVASSAPRKRLGGARLEVVTTARVWVCLEDQRGRLLINQILEPGVVSDSFVSPAFRIFLGSELLRLRINGRLHSLPASPIPAAYRITQGGIVVLPAGATAPCA
jgi:hypothetical protein